MSEELQQKLRNQLWTVANTLRGNMSAGDFMYYTLGFIFYKYLSEKIEKAADEVLQEDGMTFKEAWASNDEELKEALKEEGIQNLDNAVEFSQKKGVNRVEAGGVYTLKRSVRYY